MRNLEGTTDSSLNKVGREGNITDTRRGENTTGIGRGGNITNTARDQDQQKRETTRSNNTRNSEGTPIPKRGTELKKGETVSRQKKGQSKAMNAQEKLILICKCCEHIDRYKNGNKTVFWVMISKLLKDHIG